MSRPALILTCEHGGNRVPSRYRGLFAPHRRLLESHRGWDPGALRWAREAAAALRAPLMTHQITRLLIELNRSPHHRALFSFISRSLPHDERRHLIDTVYTPWRDAVEGRLRAAIRRSGGVIHISAHSFTPALDGVARTADVGLLYDPRRPAERRFCQCWRDALRRRCPDLRVRRNYPYRGAADGFTTYLRKALGERYVGVELEINQRYPAGPPREWAAVRRGLIASLRECAR